ncbi:MAG: cell envelope integrity protein CreD, partial [Candidatus Accumulibacter sp.]|nr:cell envelope integrity protein CreD [Accumulibacter sp.]
MFVMVVFSLVVLLILLLAAYGLLSFWRSLPRNKPRFQENSANASDTSALATSLLPDTASSTAPLLPDKSSTETAPISSPPSSITSMSVSIHCVIIVLLTLGLLLPLNFVKEIVYERSSMQKSAIRDISKSWGERQTVSGPALIIPFLRKQTYTKEEQGKSVTRESTVREYRIILPKTLRFKANIKPERRAYGIYEYVVYTAPLEAAGTFQVPK